MMERMKQEYKSEKYEREEHRIGSYEGRTGDALALGGDEGRDKLRKAAGRCK